MAAEGTDTPRQCNNIVVSIHAIATFQALHDYLRPRLSGILTSLSGARLSGVLAALSGRLPLGTTESVGQPSSSTGATSSSKVTGSSADDLKPERRRSLRLKKKSSTGLTKDKTGTDLSTAQPPPSTSSTIVDSALAALRDEHAGEPAPSETAVNDEEDFMDADVDAEVLDEDIDNDETTTEKTVTLNVAAGMFAVPPSLGRICKLCSLLSDGSKVEAQTPDGTRVATPNPPKDAASTLSALTTASKLSYASAVRARPVDWHLEFTMDDHALPLDMTIYGAVHQHELRKSNGSPMPLNLVWQGVYTVQYKKVPGPAPTPEGIDFSKYCFTRMLIS